MNREWLRTPGSGLRSRLIVAFLVATAVPLVATIWIASSLLDRSLGYATTGELDHLSRTLENTVRQFYQRERESLRSDALAGRRMPTTYAAVHADAWPEPVRAFWESGETERFSLSGSGGDHVEFMRRQPRGVEVFSRELGGIHME